MKQYKVCMTVAGSDPSGGAGIQADLKVFSKLGCYGQAVITALTVQNTEGVRRSEAVEAGLIYEQMAAVMSDWMPRAVKIGIVPTAAAVRGIARALREYKPVFTVFDPVMVSTSGRVLMDEEAVQALRKELVPCCSLITPNLPEAEVLAGRGGLSAEELAQCLGSLAGGAAVLVKGGHRAGEPTDVLYDGRLRHFTARRVQTVNSHGTGCVLSSAIAAYVAQGLALPEAVRSAKAFLTQALQEGADYHMGKGAGPLYLLP